MSRWRNHLLKTLLAALALVAVASVAFLCPRSRGTPGVARPEALRRAWAEAAPDAPRPSLRSGRAPRAEPAKIVVRHPFDHALFPYDLAPPTFRWEDPAPESKTWLLSIDFQDGRPGLQFQTKAPEWTPSEEAWRTIRRRSLKREAKATIEGMRVARTEASPKEANTAGVPSPPAPLPRRERGVAPEAPRPSLRSGRATLSGEVISEGSVSFRTSPDEVRFPILYREVNLPFRDAVKDPSRIRWRFGPVSSRSQPPIVLEKLPVCGNCHSFSADAKVLGMDVDYANEKGSYAILPVARDMELTPDRIISWSQYKPQDRQPTFGLLPQVSPDGRYVVGTVKDESVFVATDDLAFSQLFFPVKGILAVYDRQTRHFRALPGADDPALVQSNPSWSPDGKYVVFARSKAYRLKRKSSPVTLLLSKEDCREFLKEGKTFLFDLYRVPFNGGKGGKAEPLAGASHNGMSNYFAKYSPDGRWIVFCRAKSFMLLQPDSALYIVPCAGGEARRMRCNTARMNSWHSWSPDGKWLVFTSKAFSPYSQLFLTRVGPDGDSTPPVVLSRFTSADRAANIPEFVNLAPDGIHAIRERFLDDSYYATRVAVRLFLNHDMEGAEKACRKALTLNPKNGEALSNLGVILRQKGADREAETCFRDAVRYGPNDPKHHANLGVFLCDHRRPAEGIPYLRRAVKMDPELFEARYPLGVELLQEKHLDEAVEQLTAAVGIEPRDADAHRYLGIALQQLGKDEKAAAEYITALKLKPDLVPALLGAAMLATNSAEPKIRNGPAAVNMARRACEITGFKNPVAVSCLADAYAATGQWEHALSNARKAMDLAAASGDEALAASLRQKVARFQDEGISTPPLPPLPPGPQGAR